MRSERFIYIGWFIAAIVAVLWFAQPGKPSRADRLQDDAASCVASGRAHSQAQFDECMSDAWSLRNDAGSV